MSVWYVDMAAGNDANPGTALAPFRTKAQLEAVMVDGDTAYVRETGIGVEHQPYEDILNNAFILQWPTQAQAVWCGSSVALTPASWSHSGDGVYTYTIPPGLTDVYILKDYYTSINARGSHFGTLGKSASAAAVGTDAAASPTKGFSHYNNATGVVTAYFGGADPTGDVATHYVARHAVFAAIYLTGTGNVVDGIHFKAWQQDSQGAAVWVIDGSGCIIRNCRAWDLNNHSFVISGSSTLIANSTIEKCTSAGNRATGAHMTFYQAAGGTGGGNTSNLRFIGCHIERHAFLGIDGLPIASINQSGWYCHGDSGTYMRDILLVRCTSYDQQVGGAALAAWDHGPLPTNGVKSSFVNGCEDCSFQNIAHWRATVGSAKFIRCIMGFQNLGPSGTNGGGLGGLCPASSAGSQGFYCESCAFIIDGTWGGAPDGYVFGVAYYASSFINFVNCSFYEISTDDVAAKQFHMFNVGEHATAGMTFHGCIFSFRTNKAAAAAEQRVLYSGASTNLTLGDNTYGLIPDGFAHPSFGAITGSSPTNLNVVAARDGSANIINIDPFVSASDLNINPASVQYTRYRATSSPVPAGLINGAYNGSFGAYRYPAASATGARNRPGRALAGGRLRNR